MAGPGLAPHGSHSFSQVSVLRRLGYWLGQGEAGTSWLILGLFMEDLQRLFTEKKPDESSLPTDASAWVVCLGLLPSFILGQP